MTPLDRIWRLVHEMRQDLSVPVDYAERLAMAALDLQRDGAAVEHVEPYDRDRDERAERSEAEAAERWAAE